ncbi:MAG: HEAT repeat domain-containing protein [Pirellulaceae bacterium]
MKRLRFSNWLSSLCLFSFWTVGNCGFTQEPVAPVVAKASNEATKSLETIRVPSGFVKELVAAEPDLANPVAFTIDDQGRIFVCETFRQEQGVTDNRSHDLTWTDHDLAAQTVEDRIAYYQKLLPEKGAEYTRQDDRIRLLQDVDGDGRIDQSIVFADHFNQLEDGTGAGVLVVGDDVLFTCIPHLWRLSDRDGDGVSDERYSIQSGFGVRVAFRGHDMHGLIRGPDGRIYFSIGDRGYHFETKEGKRFANPETGAVFRCWPDGSHLEVVATGLRNPQELAFDQWGNLFTGDNNSDSGDRARWVYVLPGMDAGWRMSYQYLSDRGPFNREKIWHPFHQEQPAYVFPPVENLGDGPSGLIYYPGTGLGTGFDNAFLMCDFRGGTAQSGIRSFRVEANGAFWKLVDLEQPFWQVLATDLAMGPDGYLYVSDWVNGWVGEGKGWLYRFADPKTIQGDETAKTASRLAQDIEGVDTNDLAHWLASSDQRVRLKAQWELASRNQSDVLIEAIRSGETLLEQLHGLWGLQQIAREQGPTEIVLQQFVDCLDSDEIEIRTNASKILGECGSDRCVPNLIERLHDPSPRVACFAALALAELNKIQGNEQTVGDVLEQNNNQDPALRHALIEALSTVSESTILELTLSHSNAEVRRAAVVALRHQQSATVAEFLDDSEPLVVREAASAIYDLPIDDAMSSLANRAVNLVDNEEALRRSLYACYRMGTKQDCERLCAVAAHDTISAEFRELALQLVRDWEKPVDRDPAIGMWRPHAGNSLDDARMCFDVVCAELAFAEKSPAKIRAMAIETAQSLATENSQFKSGLIAILESSANDEVVRSAALRALASLEPIVFDELAPKLLVDSQQGVRIAARRVVAERNPEMVIKVLINVIEGGGIQESQEAYVDLTRILESGKRDPAIDEFINRQLQTLANGSLSPELRLELRKAAKIVSNENERISSLLLQYEAELSTGKPSQAFRDCLFGGDAERGRTLFFERTELSCVRCHRIGLTGGNVGPNLSDVGKKRDREYLLRSIVEPNSEITEKFGTVVVADESGKTYSGIVHLENADVLRLITADGEFVTIEQEAILDRRTGESAMPKDLINKLTPFELRDLVEFLSQQISEPQPDVESLEIGGQ